MSHRREEVQERITPRSTQVIDLSGDSSIDEDSPSSLRILDQHGPATVAHQHHAQPGILPPPPPPRPGAGSSMFIKRPPQQQQQQRPLGPLENKQLPKPPAAVQQQLPFFHSNKQLLQGMPRIPKQQQQQQPRFEVDDDPSDDLIVVKPAGGFASSSSAFKVTSGPSRLSTGSVGSSTSTSAGLSAKQRITQAMQEDSKSKGIPFAVPKNPPYQKPRPVAPSSSSKLQRDRDDPLDEDALPDMGFSDGLSAQDQEAALADLLSSALDLDAGDNPAEGEDEAPAELKCTLLPHQVQGLKWLKGREEGKKRGGILADDMGLGKTVQMLALILANPNYNEKVIRNSEGKRLKTTLIICPVALMEQWKNEILSKSDADLKVCIHHGTGKKSARQLQRYDVVLTSYNTAAAEWVDPKPKKAGKGKGKQKAGSDDDEGVAAALKERGALFGVEKYYRIILDEAHSIKGRQTKAHKACCDLVSHYRWCLSGTPIQNGVNDLHSLFEFLGKIVNPLHDFTEFKLKISDPLKNKRTKIAMTRLAVVLKAVMLRRTKTMMIDGKPLLQLPKREIIEVKGPFLDEDERAFYKAVEEKVQLTMNAYIKAGTAMSNYTSVLILLLRMRQACSHPSLITGSSTLSDREALEAPNPAAERAAPTEEDDLSALIGGLGGLAVSGKEERMCALCVVEPSAGREETYCAGCRRQMEGFERKGLVFSTKVRRMMKVLEGIREEDPKRKTIVFSQFTSMFDVIEPFLKAAGFKFVRFDGKLNAAQKEVALKKIREDPKTTIILISIKCGSVGLNLTCCSRVVLLDLWWNPAIEAQAFDRAHRFGQTSDVKIYKITVDSTIEDRILTLQEEKAALAKAALEGGDMTKANALSMKDMLFLFRGDGEGKEVERRRRKAGSEEEDA